MTRPGQERETDPRPEIVTFDASRPEAAFARCRDVIKAGGVIAYPTETFYGLGANPRSPAAVRRLFEIKGRPSGLPILLLIGRQEEVGTWTSAVTPAAYEMMSRFWPGAVTLVFTANQGVLPELTAGSGTIGLRVPGNDVARSLLAFLGLALTGTSANRTGGPNPRTAADVVRELGEQIDLILDAGPTPGGKPSTVVDVTGIHPRIVRHGAVAIPL